MVHSSVLKHSIVYPRWEDLPASLLLNSGKVESRFNKVDAEDEGRSGMDKGFRLSLVLISKVIS